MSKHSHAILFGLYIIYFYVFSEYHSTIASVDHLALDRLFQSSSPPLFLNVVSPDFERIFSCVLVALQKVSLIRVIRLRSRGRAPRFLFFILTADKNISILITGTCFGFILVVTVNHSIWKRISIINFGSTDASSARELAHL